MDLSSKRTSCWLDREDQAEPLHDAVRARIDRLKAGRKAVVDDIRRDHRQRLTDLAGLVGEPSDLARLRQGLDAVCGRRMNATRDEYRDRIAALRGLRSEIDDAENLDHIVLDDVAAFERSISIDWCDRSAQAAVPPGFIAERVGQSIQYWHDDRTARGPAFVERGNRIWINDSCDTSLRAALIVAQARYGVVAAHGDAAFVAQVQRLGRELGIDVQGGATGVAPPKWIRSPRVQQRRDTVRRWKAHVVMQDRGTSPVGNGPEVQRDLTRDSGDPSPSAPRARKGTVLSDSERPVILARVARLLEEKDWDPRDYRRSAAGGRGNPLEPVQVTEDRSSQNPPLPRRDRLKSIARAGADEFRRYYQPIQPADRAVRMAMDNSKLKEILEAFEQRPWILDDLVAIAHEVQPLDPLPACATCPASFWCLTIELACFCKIKKDDTWDGRAFGVVACAEREALLAPPPPDEQQR